MAQSYPVGGVQRDADGRPYILMSDGRKNYISPIAFGGQVPEDTTGIFHSRPQWNQKTGRFETPFDWGNLLNVGVGAGLGAGALSAAGLFGGGVGAAGGGGIPALSAPASVLPAGGTGMIGAAGAAGATMPALTGPASALASSSAPNWLSTAAKLGTTVAPLALRSLRGNGSDANPNGIGGDPTRQGQLDELLQLLIDKAKRTTPVHEAALRMASRLAPSMERTPRMDAAIGAAQRPRPTTSMDPQVSQAIQRLMAAGGR